jgi:hypothetical protein
MTSKVKAIIRRVSRPIATPKWRRFRPFYQELRGPQAGEALVFSTGFEEGGADGTAFPDMTGVWPSGVTVIGDWAYGARVIGSAHAGKGVRFPTTGEGGGSNNSLYRIQQGWTNAALVAAGIRTRGKASWYVKVPATGGTQYRGSTMSEYWCSALWQMDDQSSLTSLVAFNTQSELCLLNRISRIVDWSALTPTATLNITGHEGVGWHKITVEWSIGATGFIKVTWDDTLTMQCVGDTSLLESGIKMYLMSPGGLTASGSDVSCFGGMDEVAVWRTGA